MINYKKIMIIVFILLSKSLWASGLSEMQNDIVFAIGELDESGYEFNTLDFGRIRDLNLTAEGIVDPQLLPRRLIHREGPYSPDRADAVEKISIDFSLKKDSPDLILVLARAGDSVTEVSIDEKEKYRITKDMLGSAEGGIFGSYELNIGPLKKGSHIITLKMPDDGLGFNGSYSWDAIILRKGSPF